MTVVRSQMSTIEYRSYLPTSKAMAFLFKILNRMCTLSTDRAIWMHAFILKQVCCMYGCTLKLLSGWLIIVRLGYIRNLISEVMSASERLSVSLKSCFFLFFIQIAEKLWWDMVRSLLPHVKKRSMKKQWSKP